MLQSSALSMAYVLSSVCNYIYQVYAGWTLEPEMYGTFSSLFAIFYITSVFSFAIQASVARFTSKIYAKERPGVLSIFLSGLIRGSVILGISLFFLIVLTSRWIASFLKIGSTEVVVLASVSFFVFLLPATSGILQGLQKFNSLALVLLLTFVSRLPIEIILARIGYGIDGIIASITLSLAIAVILSLILLKKYLKLSNGADPYNFFDLIIYSIPTLLVMACLIVPSNVDVIMAKHNFPSYEAGLYAAASAIGKIVLFLPGMILMIMFPKIVEKGLHGKSALLLLNRCLVLTGMLSGSAALVFLHSPDLVALIFGNKYAYASHIIPLYSIMMFLLSLTWVIAYYCLAINDLKYAYVLISFTLVEIGLISFIPQSIFEMVIVMLIINAILFFISYIYIIRRKILSSFSR